MHSPDLLKMKVVIVMRGKVYGRKIKEKNIKKFSKFG